MTNNNITIDDILLDAINIISSMDNEIFDVLSISKPDNIDSAKFMAKVNSKISSIVGNMIEFSMANVLNEKSKYMDVGHWERQDPDFPDNVFVSDQLDELPGIEVKAWYPLATEITARFKASQLNLSSNNPWLALVAWAPEYILHGRPKILGVYVIPAMNLAISRDSHYYQPPHYLLIEPGDTINRTKNLQQRNVEGYVQQEWAKNMEKDALTLLKNSGISLDDYKINPTTIAVMQKLRADFPYRLDTNFAKINRIENQGVNDFKKKIFSEIMFGHPISYWTKITKNEKVIESYYEKLILSNDYSDSE